MVLQLVHARKGQKPSLKRHDRQRRILDPSLGSALGPGAKLEEPQFRGQFLDRQPVRDEPLRLGRNRSSMDKLNLAPDGALVACLWIGVE
jgi:hypothetical protein